ncbi:hypothetical protein [Methanobrevibacter sp.]|uniref:hypothetical protein n=1 Tax=Methanobrevibacter sp. TaxID=66852 RepID=UPI00386CCD72
MFQWEDFRDVAEELLAHSGEAYTRCAISRQYYSLFGSIREYLINVMHKYQFKERNDIHERIYKELIASNNSNEYEIGEIIGFLRKMRNHADYDSDLECQMYFEENLDKMLEDLEIAFNSLNFLKENPPYNL